MSPIDSGREGPFALHVDGEQSFGFVKSVIGGTLRTNVAVHADPQTNSFRKLPVSRSYDDISVEFGMGAPSSLFRWVSATIENGVAPRSGEIHACDTKGRSLGVNQFFSAKMREITFPWLDARTKEDAFISIDLSPSGVRLRPGTGEEIVGTNPSEGEIIQRSKFRFGLGNFPSSSVVWVGEIKWSLASSQEPMGSERIPIGDPIEWTEISNVKIGLPISNFQDWNDWFDEFVPGKESALELDGFVELLSEDGSVLLARIDLLGCGPASINIDKMVLTKNPEFEVELWVHSLGFSLP